MIQFKDLFSDVDAINPNPFFRLRYFPSLRYLVLSIADNFYNAIADIQAVELFKSV